MMHIQKEQGFTLLEMMLVLVVISSMVIMATNYGVRRTSQLLMDKMAMQMQQILNASLAYYTAYGAWPITTCNSALPVTPLVAAGYLPVGFLNDPYGSPYELKLPCSASLSTGSVLMVGGGTSSAVTARVIAGLLPMGSTAGAYVSSQITIPGQNLNNARSVNFAGVYKHGGCVPVPSCPTGMVPQIIPVPVSVNGVNYSNSDAVYPIASFSAYYMGGPVGSTAPDPCDTAAGSDTTCDLASPSPGAAPLYWRVCMRIITQVGDISVTNTGIGSGANGNAWGKYATMMVMTRCMPDEPYGSDEFGYTR